MPEEEEEYKQEPVEQTDDLTVEPSAKDFVITKLLKLVSLIEREKYYDKDQAKKFDDEIVWQGHSTIMEEIREQIEDHCPGPAPSELVHGAEDFRGFCDLDEQRP